MAPAMSEGVEHREILFPMSTSNSSQNDPLTIYKKLQFSLVRPNWKEFQIN